MQRSGAKTPESSSTACLLPAPPSSPERVGFFIRFSSSDPAFKCFVQFSCTSPRPYETANFCGQSSLPWAVAISWIPRWAIVRAEIASASVPISAIAQCTMEDRSTLSASVHHMICNTAGSQELSPSITMTSGMWFSTASIMTRCCSLVWGTCTHSNAVQNGDW